MKEITEVEVEVGVDLVEVKVEVGEKEAAIVDIGIEILQKERNHIQIQWTNLTIILNNFCRLTFFWFAFFNFLNGIFVLWIYIKFNYIEWYYYNTQITINIIKLYFII